MKTLASRWPVWLAVGLLGLVLLAVYVWFARSAPHSNPATATSSPVLNPPRYVGYQTCVGCHAEQQKLWSGSHHDLAMQPASEQTVLGNFNNTVFRKDGIESRFFRRDGKWLVNTDGPDGKLADFEILYTFGVSPLQQYLIALPGGRLQALSIAWDSRPGNEGGQRWFHLYPDEKIDYRDELHWTRLSQNWNFMCAECHSTDLQKNYDPSTHGYRTTWSDINVGCEACHGPGSQHVAFAGKQTGYEKIDPDTKGFAFRLDERQGVSWPVNASGQPERSQPRSSDKEIETCARCHSRRGQWFADYRAGEPLMNTHLPALLRTGLYYPDGQIDGEDYEYGSFLQSKMNHAGVTCSDCHEPHSLKLRAPGNGVCLQCHTAGQYDTQAHHHHPAGSVGAQCVSCHMPTRLYMVVDARHDHSLRVPRPDLSAPLGTPNACTQCHASKSASWAANWAASAIKGWLGHDPAGYQSFGETLQAARTGQADAGQRLGQLVEDTAQPAIARATAAAELGPWLTPESLPVLEQALHDPNPLVRGAALESVEPLPPEQRWQSAHHLLRDPVRVVRALTAEALVNTPPEQIPATDQADFEKATGEYLASLQLNADDPGSEVNRGNFLAARGEMEAAEAAFRSALAINPGWVPAYVNLSDLYRLTQREQQGEQMLSEGLVQQPRAAALHHSLGLLQVRQHNLPSALISLKKAVELAPDDTRFRYVYAVALNSAGKSREAKTMVKAGLARHPGDRGLNELAGQLSASGSH